MNWSFQKTTDLTAEEYDAIYSRLSASRKARIDQLKQPEDRRRSLLASLLIERLLQKENLTGAQLENDPEGRPYLSGCHRFVSISHCGEAVACAISHTPVGIDLERIKPVRKSLVEYICLPDERAYVLQDEPADSITDPDTLYRFFAVWTAKEAAFKQQPGQTLLKIDTLALSKTIHREEDFLITIIF